MQAQTPSPITSSPLPIGSTADNITTEEEDHLVRSTKKVKNDHDFATDMAQDPPGAEISLPINDTLMSNENNLLQGDLTPESESQKTSSPKVLSFKQVLVSNRDKEIPFSEDVELLNLGEEIDEENVTENEEEEQDGIPVIHLPKSLLDYAREPWKNALIVKPIGYPIGYKSLCSKVRSIWDLQGDFSALDIGMGFVVFKFDMGVDRTNVTQPEVAEPSSSPVTASEQNSGDKTIANQQEYGHWTLVQRKTRRPTMGKRSSDRNQLAHVNKPVGPNSQRLDPRQNRYSLLNWFDASSSGTKKPSTPNKSNGEAKQSQPIWAKVKTNVGGKPTPSNLSGPTLMDFSSLTSESSPNPTSNLPPQAQMNLRPNPSNLSTTRLTENSHSTPLSTAAAASNPTPPPPNLPSPTLSSDGPVDNRSLPPSAESNLHPNQTRGRGRSTDKSRVDNKGNEHESDGTRIQRSRSPTLRNQSGEPERDSEGSNSGQEVGRME
ncbi:hypothetical protein Vadar_001923 [Vaccinium darrowii]|uniref:Uncharacterized protein n=1 Tax=Vaccinium darrowii TaxID=229202 RepID=A0ACB7YSR2_9ERIC|nr:hypothetical protein Vadar_001923 [Vaccinium darrowii]